MKKWYRLTAVLLSVLMVLLMIPFVPVKVSAATQQSAIDWLYAQSEAWYDLDNAYGAQCSDFVSAYMNWLVNGDAFGGPYGVYNANYYPTVAGWNPERWEVIQNYDDLIPQPGDIFVTTGLYPEYGHTGVVLSSEKATAMVIDQNSRTDNQSAYIHKITWANSYTPTYFIRYKGFSTVHECNHKGGYAGISSEHPHYDRYYCSICGKDSPATSTEHEHYVDSCSVCNPTATSRRQEALDWLYAQSEAWYDLDNANGAQCSDFVSAYMNWLVCGDAKGGPYAVYNAKDYPTVAGWNPERWTVIENYADFIPQPGDIFVSAGLDQNYGHTGVVLSSEKATATVIDQNSRTDNQSAYIHSITWIRSYAPTYFIRFKGFSAHTCDQKGGLAGVDTEHPHYDLYFCWICGKPNAIKSKEHEHYLESCRICNPPRYTVSFDANGGTGAPADQIKRHDTSLTLSLVKPQRNGYRFLGWSTQKNATSPTYLAGSVYTANQAVKLYAVWEKEPAVLEKVSIKTAPSKTTYTIGETLDTSGLVLLLTYNDGSTKTVSTGFTTSGFDASTAGTKTVTVTYEGKTTTFTVTVQPNTSIAAPQFVLESKRAQKGQEVTVQVRLANNPGIISLRLNIGYDAAVLTLKNAAVKDLSAASFGPLENDPFILSWSDAIHGDMTDNCVVAELTFLVNPDAADGDTSITISYDPEDVYNSQWEDIPFTCVNSTITIVSSIPGDIDHNGKINMKDYGLLQQYLNGWDVDIDRSAADVNGDGKINMKDLSLLQQYLNGWEVDLR